MNLVQAYHIPIGEHSTTSPAEEYLIIVKSGVVGQYNYFVEDVWGDLRDLGRGDLSQILKKYGVYVQCEHCGTKTHVGVGSMGDSRWDRYLCSACHSLSEYINLNYWSVLDHQRYSPDNTPKLF